jgi:Flp pilus assembly protein TadG
MLMPAAVLIVVMLGAIAVDLSLVYLGRRELAAAASAAANDAATYGVDQEALRSGQGYLLDPERVEAAALASLEARGLDVDVFSVDAVVVGTDEVRVTITGRVSYLFAPAVPGGPEEAAVSATASALAGTD